jgi:hypothetical protein
MNDKAPCPICKELKSKSNMARHIKNMHGEDKYNELRGKGFFKDLGRSFKKSFGQVRDVVTVPLKIGQAMTGVPVGTAIDLTKYII